MRHTDISPGLGIRLGRDTGFLCTSSHIHVASFVKPDEQEILPSLVLTSTQKRTIEDTHLSLEMVPFYNSIGNRL